MTTVWLVGRFDRPETAPLAAEVPRLLPGAASFRFATPNDAAAAATAADLVVAVQFRPSEFPNRDIDRLIGSQPLARFVVGLGPWCASYGRSEAVWPESVVVPLWEVSSRLRREAAVIAGAEAPVPLTAGRDESVLAERPPRPRGAGRHVLVDSPDAAFAELLADVARDGGAEPLTNEGAAVPSLLLWDADPLDPERLGRLAALRGRRPACRVVTFTALPTPADFARLRKAGADAVLPKPFRLAELIDVLGE